MKKSSDRLNVGSAGNEKIGMLLSASLKQTQDETCLSSEEIAALVDGNIEVNERDRIMKHLSACDRCYDVFLLASGLNEQKIIPMKRPFFSHPMRLAASIIIAAFSLFLFYKIVFIPGVSDKPDLKFDPGKKTAVPLMKEAYGAAAEPPQEKIQPEIEVEKGGEKKAVLGGVGQQEVSADRDIDRQKEERGMRQLQKTRQDERVRQEVPKENQILQQTVPQQKQIETEQPAAGQQQYAREEKDRRRLKTAVPEKVALGDKRKKGGGPGKSAAVTAVPAGIESASWSAFEGLKGELSRYKAYIPEEKIENFFQVAVITAERLQHEFMKQEEERFAIDGVTIEEIPGKRLAPVMRFESERGIVSIFPDTRYFLGKSQTGTRAYRFFNLALSGWCDERGCYGEMKGKIDKKKRKKLLKSWQVLRPELQGIFLTIAERTIHHLSK